VCGCPTTLTLTGGPYLFVTSGHQSDATDVATDSEVSVAEAGGKQSPRPRTAPVGTSHAKDAIHASEGSSSNSSSNNDSTLSRYEVSEGLETSESLAASMRIRDP
jgi:hypothetical protein